MDYVLAIFFSFVLAGMNRIVNTDNNRHAPPASQYARVKLLDVPYISSAPEKRLPTVRADMPKCHSCRVESEGIERPALCHRRAGRAPPSRGKAKAYSIP